MKLRRRTVKVRRNQNKVVSRCTELWEYYCSDVLTLIAKNDKKLRRTSVLSVVCL